METKMTIGAADDAALASGAASGDERAFKEIVSKHKAAVYSTALRITGSAADADEVAQDVFVKVYFSLRKFEARSSLATWIYRIAVNAALDRSRKNKKRPATAGEAFREDMVCPSDASSPPNPAGSAADAEDVRRLLLSLDEKYRAPLVLREYEGMKYDEISRVLGISVGQVKIRIFRAREEIRNNIGACRTAMKDTGIKAPQSEDTKAKS
ncbi:MAG: sigma-70 family RNA polymerase sigma factor [Endomicrobiia bacterium]|nr:sigma-70 family RNA polymerase sigma factor [Endomicrobiia bacterium]